MTRGIYVSAMTNGSGKSLISLGLADMLHRHADRVGFFRPIVEGGDPSADPMVRLMQRTFDLPESRARGGLTRAEARALLVTGDRAEIDARCVAIYSEIAAECDVVIVEGTDLSGNDAAVEFDLNARLANNLGAMVLAVVSAKDMSVDEAADAVDVARRELDAAKVSLLAMMVNRAADDAVTAISEQVRPGRSGRPVYVIPELTEISQPTVSEVSTELGARQIAGNSNLERDVTSVRVAAMNVGNFLHLLRDGALVIVPGDRADVLVATLASSFSAEFPVPSGMFLTGGLAPDPNILALLAQAPFPVFTLDEDTYTVARRVSEVRGEIASGLRRKAAAALGAWSRQVDETELLERLELPRPVNMTPLRFLHELIQRARAERRHIVLPEGEDIRVLKAAEILRRRDVCDLSILGPESTVRELASGQGIDLTGITLIDPSTSDLRDEFAEEYARLRAHKNVSLDQARERMLEGAYFGTMMVQLGKVDGMVSGAAHTTANTIRPALEFVKTKDGVKIVSSVFLMLLQDRVLVYGDCAVNPGPNDEQLADIAVASAETAEQFGVQPRVAMLSYSTGESGSGGAVDEVRRATELVRKLRPDLAVEGPIQYDAAVDASVAESKLPGSSVAGQATVFIFPDLNTGNNTYKAVQQSAGAVAVGPVLQGLRKPVNDLSRGCTVEDIVNTVAITAVQAQQPTAS
ncbi:phosphate acetyltransferase [Arthrobacter agilis]|uniref:phosphate acetyltransferase n=1 Tax=Arthrobacter agilis TaxID=37921 RepID=UPI000B34C3A5|nr:phosphate acetyltransferase [Arthrobacter agilis]OUM42424.1 phosphate acetyltransferase [Arthrobacter agilis]PPB45765.1 phosphate acetyltransferase [Arthrobacter agilis]TPV26252.1 phosphate acetyltransferase [Arthrobacter agilis]VDR30900.1 Phosphate acetyltransferase [Arthrobacter agilis]